MTALTSRWHEVIEASEQLVLGFQETTRNWEENVFIQGWDEVFSFLQIHRNLLFPNIYILLHKLLRELEWEWEGGARKDIRGLRVCLFYCTEVWLQLLCMGESHQPLTFKLYILPPGTISLHQCVCVCVKYVFWVIFLSWELNCVCVWVCFAWWPARGCIWPTP